MKYIPIAQAKNGKVIAVVKSNENHENLAIYKVASKWNNNGSIRIAEAKTSWHLTEYENRDLLFNLIVALYPVYYDDTWKLSNEWTNDIDEMKVRAFENDFE